MNMKFMKRKQEIEDHEQKRKRLSTDRNNVEPPVSNPSTNGFVEQLPSTLAARPYDAATQQQQQHQHEDSMDMDEPVSSNKIAYEVATPMDMYEIQASLIGRRSFGGFNAAMEEAWKSSEASRKEQTSQLRKAKVSDEELIQRYQDIVNKRSKSSRVVGNLNEKSVSKRQRRHVK